MPAPSGPITNIEARALRAIDVWWTRILSIVALIVSIAAIIAAQE